MAASKAIALFSYSSANLVYEIHRFRTERVVSRQRGCNEETFRYGSVVPEVRNIAKIPLFEYF